MHTLSYQFLSCDYLCTSLS